MTRIRRFYQYGNIYFLTHVTYTRMPILIENWDILDAAIKKAQTPIPFDLVAWAVLPDHMHMIIEPGKNDLSRLIKRIKQSFSMNYRKRAGYSGRVWQYRFWDHVIRDDEDFRRHVDYIHFNAVKHGLATGPLEFPFSSFHEYYKSGYYSADWGVIEKIESLGDYGE